MNDLLDLPGCTLLNQQETDIDIRLDIEYTGEEPLVCPHCGSLGQPYKGYSNHSVESSDRTDEC